MMTNQIYIRTVLDLYVQLPGTPRRICHNDRVLAEQWFVRQIPIEIVETALRWGAARRLYGPPNALRLPPVRSIAYFAPVVEELVSESPPQSYIHYLRHKLGLVAGFNTG